ncbi:MAG: CBS domain-containing protein [Bradyrhizobium sp.]|uniref:CBS domain-containing protein n=1 Tax=Bradyrhizobium sp. TaxID=376 RepID=UPI00272F2129|nr:CBS domain-containing protein [Bradyrhizobium sp.]MDP1865677.1 CBS domain-containing protein [Bradyrhizobium sp.]
MQARNVMVTPVVTVKPSATVQEVAARFLESKISAAPVVDDTGKLVGIVSEGDLLHRVEADTERRRSWLLRAFTEADTLAAEYVKSHGRRVSDVMTRTVITAAPETPLHEIATLLEKNAIKRVPILENGQLVGVVSRANLLQAVASARPLLDVTPSDTMIRDRILASLRAERWAHIASLNVTVTDGVVDLWGLADSKAERKAIKVAAETTPGVRAVNDNMVTFSGGGWT